MRTRSGCLDRREFAIAFSRVQEDLRQDPYRLGLAGVSYGAQFVENQLPMTQEFWILEDSQKNPQGRIAANLSPVYPHTGYLGFFEAVDFKAAQTLVHAAFDWLKTQGVTQVFGPINFNTWLPYRFRIEEDDTPFYTFEPVNPPQYPLWFCELGFQIAETYHSLGIEGNEGSLEKMLPDFDRALSMGYSFRQANSSGDLETELRSIYDISMTSFQDNFLFEPIPFEAFRQLYVPTVQKSQTHAIYFLCEPTQGKTIGYISTFLEQGNTVMKTIALLPEGRGLRLSNALFYQGVFQGKLKGSTGIVPALVRNGIQSESYCKNQKTLWKHRYALFRKEVG